MEATLTGKPVRGLRSNLFSIISKTRYGVFSIFGNFYLWAIHLSHFLHFIQLTLFIHLFYKLNEVRDLVSLSLPPPAPPRLQQCLALVVVLN